MINFLRKNDRKIAVIKNQYLDRELDIKRLSSEVACEFIFFKDAKNMFSIGFNMTMLDGF